MSPLLALLATAAAAPTNPPLTVHGDAKSFFVATFPYEHLLMPEDPVGQATVDGRLKLLARAGDWLKVELHHAVTATAGEGLSLGLASTGAGASAPEAVELSWTGVSASGLVVKGRTDRLVVTATRGPVTAALGRQPVSFGTGLFFTPLDVVNPFTPATIDQDYKPGIDAARVDLYPSFSSQITLVAAYVGDWSLDGTILAANGKATVGVTDLGLFAGVGRGSPVFGASVASGVGAIGLHGDASLTLPRADPDAKITDPYVRAVVGADGRPSAKSSLAAELYFQSFGETDPDRYLILASDPRYSTGELWAMGLLEAGISGTQEITPTLIASLALVGNLIDPSALVAPGLAWSVSSEADLALGAYMGVGKRPHAVALTDLVGSDGLPLEGDALLSAFGVESEYGLLPVTAFLQMKACF